ncbi:MAG: hypothetical protein BGP24_15045 [Lysobacterales bacterium 69-70]|nr:MAG: hypothetical protein ABS97_05870 [Xanthomonadaceae bacterium SCN 69-320]ODV16837.1 MAG: hypothetical protein ABT27_18845 [Xanthomonadaceae bacterium SCN 69-25]OJY94293.1 MAG: hypothetical protein BGP24_15045 [Xanthomonadales bacterium 69-70]
MRMASPADLHAPHLLDPVSPRARNDPRTAAGATSAAPRWTDAGAPFRRADPLTLAASQDALDRIGQRDAPVRSGAVRSWLRHRRLSLGMIAVIGFFLVITLVVSTLLSAARTRQGRARVAVDGTLTLATFVLAFAALSRFVPDESPHWRPIAAGVFVAAMLLDAGKRALGAYPASSDRADACGTSGSVVLLLVRVRYSSLIVLVGAGFTRWAANRGPGTRGREP